MFLVASSRGNVVPTTPNDQATNFFKSTNSSKAQQYLENYLEAREIECTIPTAVANLWLQGCLLWLNPLTPSGLATSAITCKDIIFNDTIHEGILLDFSTKHEITKNSLTKLTKTQVMYPNSMELMLERINAIAAFAELFFTDKTYLIEGLNYLRTICTKSNRTLLRIKLYLDKMFIAKFLFSIDDRINKWLGECGRVSTVEQTSLELVGFISIITDLKLNRYYCDLPNSIKSIAKGDDEKTENKVIPTRKRKSSGDGSNNLKVISNDKIENEWKLKDQELWQDWRHKVGNAPLLSCNSKPCLKYHVKGTCFEDCKNKASHRKLTGKDYEMTDNFIKKVRASSK